MLKLDIKETTLEEMVSRLREKSREALTDAQKTVDEIVEAVRKGGDEALLKYIRTLDSPLVTKRNLFASEEEFDAAREAVSDEFLRALRRAKSRIEDYHRRQLRESWFYVDEDGNLLGQKVTPIEKVGCCVPGRRAPLPSSLLMCAIPAKVAGVKEIVVITPPNPESGRINPRILVAAKEVGVERILRAGGAQGVAALAFGTESVPKVQKIVGPGNIYVTLAKKAVFGEVGIDSLAGPSEILVLADEAADPSLVAADLLSQAEHAPDSMALAVSTSKTLLEQIENELKKQLSALKDDETARASLENNGALIRVDDIGEALEFANLLSPEHLCLAVESPFSLIDKIENAGAILLGQQTSEPIADYLAGPSHVLPTAGTAAFSSGLSVHDFLKFSSLVMYSDRGLERCAADVITLAQSEGLDAHAKAIIIRIQKNPKTNR